MTKPLEIVGEVLFLAAVLISVFVMTGSLGHTFGKHQCSEPHGRSAFASPSH